MSLSFYTTSYIESVYIFELKSIFSPFCDVPMKQLVNSFGLSKSIIISKGIFLSINKYIALTNNPFNGAACDKNISNKNSL
jgi:hypothetical protein